MDLSDDKINFYYNKDVIITTKDKIIKGKIMGSGNSKNIYDKVKVLFLWKDEKLVNIIAEDIIQLELI